MQLKELKIERKTWGKDEGKHVGKASFDNELGLVAIKLTPELCNEIFRLCADGIVSTAKEAAKELTFSVIEHQAKLEDGV